MIRSRSSHQLSEPWLGRAFAAACADPLLRCSEQTDCHDVLRATDALHHLHTHVHDLALLRGSTCSHTIRFPCVFCGALACCCFSRQKEGGPCPLNASWGFRVRSRVFTSSLLPSTTMPAAVKAEPEAATSASALTSEAAASSTPPTATSPAADDSASVIAPLGSEWRICQSAVEQRILTSSSQPYLRSWAMKSFPRTAVRCIRLPCSILPRLACVRCLRTRSFVQNWRQSRLSRSTASIRAISLRQPGIAY